VWEGELIENQTEWIIEEATQLTNWTEICATTEFTFPFTNTGAIRVFRVGHRFKTNRPPDAVKTKHLTK
jgi:hypothetical protein